MTRGWIALAMALLLTVPAAAGEGAQGKGRRGGPRIGFYGGPFVPGGTVLPVPGAAGAIRIGGSLGRHAALEGNLTFAMGYGSSLGGGYAALAPSIDLLLLTRDDRAARAFAVLAPGLLVDTLTGPARFAMGFGGGFQLRVGGKRSPLYLRLDARYRLSPVLRSADPLPMGFLEWTAGWLIAAPARPKVVDRDADGVPDQIDDCPGDPEDRDGLADVDGCPDVDVDGDGVLDEDDLCPTVPGAVAAQGCAPADGDGDGVADVDDRCPAVPGAASAGGCPDGDGDGVVDRDDDCPAIPGPAATRGCPDRDGDRIADRYDECPDEPVDPRTDPEHSDGCPSRVVITGDQLVLLDKIFFDSDADTIKAVSFPILDALAATLMEYVEIQRVEVAGHTDASGPDGHNLALSQSRAEAVVAYLVGRGVRGHRLIAKGYGEGAPIADNDTDEGKAANRRVEFRILADGGAR